MLRASHKKEPLCKKIAGKHKSKMVFITTFFDSKQNNIKYGLDCKGYVN